MARRRHGRTSAGGGDGHDSSGSGRWMVSYMDMVTVLMCLFIVLFAMSSVDQSKYQELKSSLAAGFGTVADADVVEARVGSPAKTPEEAMSQADADLERAKAEVANLTALRDAMSDDLADRGMSDDVRFDIDERGLTVRLVSADTFFSSSSAELTADARRVLKVVGPVLEPTSYQVRIEGHADEVALRRSVYPTNWELSAARATAVLRHLVAMNSVENEQVAAVGYGSARPLVPGKDAKSLAANRRVDVVVLSAEPEAVRALIPGILRGAEGGSAES
ncbi:OmpA/MotB family protein [Isoptericola rhizosphaerae]|uniref:OmpA/MotB family protein n=1 Tax=Isoptericola rhizosphaerae TaxID=3377837 RepID=UPI00383BB557